MYCLRNKEGLFISFLDNDNPLFDYHYWLSEKYNFTHDPSKIYRGNYDQIFYFYVVLNHLMKNSISIYKFSKNINDMIEVKIPNSPFYIELYSYLVRVLNPYVAKYYILSITKYEPNNAILCNISSKYIIGFYHNQFFSDELSNIQENFEIHCIKGKYSKEIGIIPIVYLFPTNDLDRIIYFKLSFSVPYFIFDKDELTSITQFNN